MGGWNEGAKTGLEETVRRWIEWARQELPEDGDIPPIFNPLFHRTAGSDLNPAADWDSWWRTQPNDPESPSKGKETPWASHFLGWDYLDIDEGGLQLLRTIEHLLLPDPNDLPSRFVALGVYYHLAQLQSLYVEDVMSAARKRHAGNLAYLVGLVHVEDCHDWRRVRWEILNTYVVRDCWDRATALYDRAEKLGLLEPGQIQVLRAQFKFLAALEPVKEQSLDSLFWPPEIYSPGSFQSVLLFGSGLIPAEPTTTVDDFQKEMLRDVAHDLETALAKRNELSPAYRAVLARCYFLTDHLADAAKQYEKLLSEPLDVFGKDFKFAKDFKREVKGAVYRSAATTLQRDGQTEKAREISERWLTEYPDDPEALRLMADVEAGACNHEAAYEYLRRLVELRRELQEDLATKIALALGALRESDKSVDQVAKFLESNPWLASLIDSMEKVHWSCFSELSPQSQSEWRSGLCEIYLFASVVPQDRIRRYESAIKHFAKVVELEIRTRVFDTYRKEVPVNNQGLGLPWPRRDRGRKYLHNFLIDRGRLNLDKIIGILEGLATSEDPVAKPFHAWLRETKGKLLEKTSALRSVCGPRGDAAHQEMACDLVGVESVAQSCRQVLNSFLAPSPHHARPAVRSPRN